MAILIEELDATEITAWSLTLTAGRGFVTLSILILYASGLSYPSTPDSYRSSRAYGAYRTSGLGVSAYYSTSYGSSGSKGDVIEPGIHDEGASTILTSYSYFYCKKSSG